METGNPADISELEVRLSSAGDDSTVVELDHTAVVPDDAWGEYGPGAVGVGWDMGVLGLALHLRGDSVGDPLAWQVSAEGREFCDPQQRGVGRREPRSRRRPGHRRARRGEHDRVLCAGAARRDVADRSAAPKNRAGRVRVNVGVSLAPPTASSTLAPPTA